MLKKILVGTLAALLVTAIGFSVYNVQAQSEAQKAAAAVEQQKLAVQATDEQKALAAAQDASEIIDDQSTANETSPAVEDFAAADTTALPRTFAPADSTQAFAGNQGATQGKGAQAATGSTQGRWGQSQNGQGRWGQSTNGQGSQGQNGQSQVSQGQNGQAQSSTEPGTGIPAPQNGMSELITLAGIVTSYAPPSLTLTTADGQVFTVEVGNLNYLSSLGASITSGEGVTITGFYDQNGGLTVSTLTLDSGASYTLRDELGRPSWRGRK